MLFISYGTITTQERLGKIHKNFIPRQSRHRPTFELGTYRIHVKGLLIRRQSLPQCHVTGYGRHILIIPRGTWTHLVPPKRRYVYLSRKLGGKSKEGRSLTARLHIEHFISVTMNITASWGVTPCDLVHIYRNSNGIFRLYLVRSTDQAARASQQAERNLQSLPDLRFHITVATDRLHSSQQFLSALCAG
jgi:hypothetical protein